ncbi:MAG: B12-binding domain-containing radical SAM protein [Proteobacteria bacterium]|nr:B12-binding domain-containing radical SAM protein [Pseudomonadota bacterium]
MKFALVSFGNEENYGLLFAGTEFKKHGEIKFFDAEMTDPLQDIAEYKPDYICFSPLTAFYPQAKHIESMLRPKLKFISIYGGHHATNCGEHIGDITVVGSVHNMDLNHLGIQKTGPTKPENLKNPARVEYFQDIPHFKNRYRKIMLSVTGCPWTCTYCSSSSQVTRKLYGRTSCHLQHRNIEDIINEANFIKDCTQEIEWVDDDVFVGDQDWLKAFYKRWVSEIGMPMYVSTTSVSALKASPDLLMLMRNVANVVGLGVQATNPESLKLLGRGWDNEAQIKAAYDRLTSFGFKVNLQCIIGLPIPDPVSDALNTIEGMKRIGAGSVVSCYPLQIYPNTALEQHSKDNLYLLNAECNGDTNSGLPAIDFGHLVNNRIRNICKLATMVVKYNVPNQWLEAMMDLDLSASSQPMSLVRYYECIRDRLPDKADKIFHDIVKGMNVRY